MRRLRLLIGLLLLVAIVMLTAPAAIAAANDALPLRSGSAGPNVAKLKYLIRAPRPRQNVFTKVKGLYPPGAGMGGWWNDELGRDVYAYKFRLGYPAAYNSKTHPVAGAYFFGLLRGTAHRPARWVSIAAGRVAAVQASTPTPLALSILKIEQAQVGVSESWGNNRGPQVDAYSRYFGLPLGLSYCVIGQQWSFAQAGFRPPFANGTFSAYGVADYYAARNLLGAKPRFAAVVVFVDYDRYGHRIPGTGHVGLVTRVTAGGYYTIEFNTGYGSSAGVRPRFHGFHDRGNVFATVPGVTTRR